MRAANESYALKMNIIVILSLIKQAKTYVQYGRIWNRKIYLQPAKIESQQHFGAFVETSGLELKVLRMKTKHMLKVFYFQSVYLPRH